MGKLRVGIGVICRVMCRVEFGGMVGVVGSEMEVELELDDAGVVLGVVGDRGARMVGCALVVD